jgi:hypothetical protein
LITNPITLRKRNESKMQEVSWRKIELRASSIFPDLWETVSTSKTRIFPQTNR